MCSRRHHGPNFVLRLSDVSPLEISPVKYRQKEIGSVHHSRSCIKPWYHPPPRTLVALVFIIPGQNRARGESKFKPRTQRLGSFTRLGQRQIFPSAPHYIELDRVDRPLDKDAVSPLVSNSVKKPKPRKRQMTKRPGHPGGDLEPQGGSPAHRRLILPSVH